MQPIEVVKQYASAFNAHNTDAVLALFAADGTYADPVSGVVGQEGLAGYMSGLIGAFPDLQFELVGLASASDDRVVLEWVMHGTNTGPSATGPATGRTLAMPGVDLVKVVDGRIVTLVAYFDRMTYAEQMGLIGQEQPA